MRFSRLFAPTTKEAPKDAILPSHIYLVRGGFISQIGSGIYNFMPLGKRVLEKIRKIVKEELDAAGCQEVQLGFVTPATLWKESGRYGKFGKELLRFKDRKENEFVLGPTHEEAMVDLVRNRVRSYKQLPLHLYQIGLKFRDEARPRFGLLRGREFLMKDGYSFHEDEEDMRREYKKMEEVYSKILDRLGLTYRIVEADSGAIGGSGSKEFMVLAKNGEDDIVVCEGCEYAANIEAAKRVTPSAPEGEVEMEAGKFHTPGVTSIEELSAFFRIDPWYLMKAVAKKAIYEDHEEIVLFFLRGSDTLEETKALNAVGALELTDATQEELEEAGIVPGFIGPEVENVKIIIDKALEDAENLICGANEKDYHRIGYSLKNKPFLFADITAVREGDRCIRCGGRLKITKGIEVGHIFQLGTAYSEALDARFLDRNGKSVPFVMGTYGIGVSRLVAVVIEQYHDDRGCIWTPATAPYQVEIIISNVKDEAQRSYGEALYEKLRDAGVEVLLDDRSERFGFKMSDFELIGIPTAVIVGKGLLEGNVEIVDRKTLQKRLVEKERIFEELVRS
ncbi:MAG: proline--tRNA ligase [Campylobacteraceae bacterium 4484_4]|nr:MAG: proline--tRNA ligase [Campylobacteraceae bacterium 4484_4]